MTRIPMSQADEQARQLREKLDLSTAEIGLQVRTTNCLEEKVSSRYVSYFRPTLRRF